MSDAVRNLRADSVSGASELILRGARVLRDAAEGNRARSKKAFVAALAKVGLMWDPLESTCRHASLSIL